jgi:nondiscriminating glutamyl-tRNA synthetase
MSYLALLGFHPGDDREILSRLELLEAFSLDRVGKSGSVFDPDKLRWTNAHYLHHASGARLLDWISAEVEAGRRPGARPTAWAEAFARLTAGVPTASLERMLELIRGNLATLGDVPGELEYLLEERVERLEPEAAPVLDVPKAREVCTALADELERLADWSADAVKSALQRVGKNLGLKGRELFQPVRVALTGRTHGPELPLLAEFIGRDRCVMRLQAAAARRGSS